jgi:hypothetical protein
LFGFKEIEKSWQVSETDMLTEWLIPFALAATVTVKEPGLQPLVGAVMVRIDWADPTDGTGTV